MIDLPAQSCTDADKHCCCERVERVYQDAHVHQQKQSCGFHLKRQQMPDISRVCSENCTRNCIQ